MVLWTDSSAVRQCCECFQFGWIVDYEMIVHHHVEVTFFAAYRIIFLTSAISHLDGGLVATSAPLHITAAICLRLSQNEA